MSTPFFSVRRALAGCLALLAAGCTDPYMPDVITSPPSYLVVDGFLNAQGVTTIRLSHTFAVASKGAAPIETRATVYIEDEAGTRTVLREGVAGTYASAGALVLNPTRKYRLHLNTLAGKEYASDFVPVKITPAIDNVTWRIDNGFLNSYVNTHDATNTTQYYRWETDETWEIRPVYSPSIEYANGSIRFIAVPFPAVCYGNTHSTTVQLDKTTALTQDVVSDFRLKQLPSNSERLYSRYSILVQQHALTQEEYAYWELLRKNTESLGSLFDAQPVQLTGNVHCLNGTDIALGFVGAHSLAEKRIFVAHADLPTGLRVLNGYEQCIPPDTVFLYPKTPSPPRPADILSSAFAGQVLLPIDQLFNMTGMVIGYTSKPRDCVDCRTRGTAVKPSFWP